MGLGVDQTYGKVCKINRFAWGLGLGLGLIKPMANHVKSIDLHGAWG